MVNSFSLSLICSGQGYASQLQAKPRLGERYVKVTLTTANSTGFHCFSSTKVDFCVEKMFYEPFWVRTSVLILTIHTVVLSAPPDICNTILCTISSGNDWIRDHPAYLLAHIYL